jgi:hypothetical protein
MAKLKRKFTAPGSDETGYGFIRPLRLSYKHTTCEDRGTTVTCAQAEDMAKNPQNITQGYCATHGGNYPASEFVWFNRDGSISAEIFGS